MRHFHNPLYVSRGIHEETDGLKQALSLARNNKAPLTALVIAPELPKNMTDYKPKYEKAIVEDMRESIVKTAESIKISQAEVKFEVEMMPDKTPATNIIQHVLQNNHDLVIKESEYHGKQRGVKALDMDLLRKCPCPVWLCRPIEKSRDTINVAVAIDPISEEPASQALSQRMLELAQSIAESCSGQLQIFSCWNFEFEDYLRSNPWVNVSEDKIQTGRAEALKMHEDALDALIKKADIHGRDHHVHHIHGPAEEKIPELSASNAIDILVMGTLARTGIPGFIIGNTAENIIQKLSCSLVALKPNGFISPVKAYS